MSEKLLDAVGVLAGFKQTQRQALKNGTCVCCAGDATIFRDELSKREFQISRLCQKCQDDIFGGPPK